MWLKQSTAAVTTCSTARHIQIKKKERKKETRLALSLPCGFFSSFFFFFFLSFFLSSLLSSHYYMFEVSFTWRPLQLFNARPRLYTQGDGPTGALTISQHEPSVTWRRDAANPRRTFFSRTTQLSNRCAAAAALQSLITSATIHFARVRHLLVPVLQLRRHYSDEI